MRYEKTETIMNYLHSDEGQQSESADGNWWELSGCLESRQT